MALRKGSSSVALSAWPSEVQMNPADVPGLEVKLGALVVLFSITLVCGFAPLCFVRGAGRCNVDPETCHKVVSLVSCFAGGVFFATCLLDLVPDYLSGINEAFSSLGITLQFPLPEFIIAMGFFLVLVLEQIVLALKDRSAGHSEERRALLVDPSVQSHDRDGRRHSHHSHVFEGLAVGLQEDSQEVLEIGVALFLHKSIISFSLALKLVQGKLRRAAVVGCLLLFALMSPLGIGLGIALTETKSSPQHQLARSTLEGLASGTFMYITFMEILPHELSSPQNRIPKVAMMLTGFAVVTGVLFIKM
ncbi:zinc transporter ZIP1 isoform X2 [Coregonus clupeaformis]|uniref:zinc transporter ZIP1 isoform X2 n=1 Tax=Coregonus clupeaformis TaxID=59861 RepID=UPI001E1C7CA0|nr:zinc transporter ZIP1 isoform X2 [Coregonus clupeaformis]